MLTHGTMCRQNAFTGLDTRVSSELFELEVL